jgi:hypothetical protein
MEEEEEERKLWRMRGKDGRGEDGRMEGDERKLRRRK